LFTDRGVRDKRPLRPTVQTGTLRGLAHRWYARVGLVRLAD